MTECLLAVLREGAAPPASDAYARQSASCFKWDDMAVNIAVALRTFIPIAAMLLASCAGVAYQPNQVTDLATGEAVQTTATRAGANSKRPPYRFTPGDEIEIKFYYNSRLDDRLRVGPDGRVAFQLIGELQVAGMTTGELREELVARYSEHQKNPEIAVLVREYSSQIVFVGGEVLRPGAVDNPGNMTATRAVMAAGGFKQTAQLSSVVVLRDNGGADPIFMSIDLETGLEGRGHGDIYLRPYDVVFVPPTMITRMNQAVKQYVRDMIPIDLQANYSWIDNSQLNSPIN